MIKRRVAIGLVLLAAAGTAAAWVAVPSDEELELAGEHVELLTKNDYQAVRDGKLSRAGLGDVMVKYAKNLDPAAKYLLLRAAFRQYALADDAKKAGTLYAKMFEHCGADYATSVAKFSLATVMKMSTGEDAAAKEFVERAASDAKRAKYIGVLRETASRAGADGALFVRMGTEYAAMGDWDSALREFANAEGEHAEAAAFEREWPRTGATMRTSADQANFWWRCAENVQTPMPAAEFFRRKAAQWYAAAVTNGVARGVKRTLAEQRIAEVQAAAARGR